MEFGFKASNLVCSAAVIAHCKQAAASTTLTSYVYEAIRLIT